MTDSERRRIGRELVEIGADLTRILVDWLPLPASVREQLHEAVGRIVKLARKVDPLLDRGDTGFRARPPGAEGMPDQSDEEEE